jgi:hypothetical protein
MPQHAPSLQIGCDSPDSCGGQSIRASGGQVSPPLSSPHESAIESRCAMDIGSTSGHGSQQPSDWRVASTQSESVLQGHPGSPATDAAAALTGLGELGWVVAGSFGGGVV